MNTILISALWDASNLIRKKVYNEYYESDYDKTFKMFIRTKKGKQLVNEYSKRYINKMCNELQIEVEYIGAVVKSDELLIEVKTEEWGFMNQINRYPICWVDKTYMLAV